MIKWDTIKTANQIADEQQHAENQSRIAELKRLLSDTDYVALADYDKDKTDVIAQRQKWRDEIRALEG